MTKISLTGGNFICRGILATLIAQSAELGSFLEASATRKTNANETFNVAGLEVQVCDFRSEMMIAIALSSDHDISIHLNASDDETTKTWFTFIGRNGDEAARLMELEKNPTTFGEIYTLPEILAEYADMPVTYYDSEYWPDDRDYYVAINMVHDVPLDDVALAA